jgi:hypothetical protein
VDELRVDVMLVLLGGGLRLFEDAGLERVQLEKLGVQEVGARTSLTFRVKAGARAREVLVTKPVRNIEPAAGEADLG